MQKMQILFLSLALLIVNQRFGHAASITGNGNNPQHTDGPPPAPKPAVLYYDADGKRQSFSEADLGDNTDVIKLTLNQVVKTAGLMKSAGCDADCVEKWAQENINALHGLSATLHTKIQDAPKGDVGKIDDLSAYASQVAVVVANNRVIDEKIAALDETEKRLTIVSFSGLLGTSSDNNGHKREAVHGKKPGPKIPPAIQSEQAADVTEVIKMLQRIQSESQALDEAIRKMNKELNDRKQAEIMGRSEQGRQQPKADSYNHNSSLFRPWPDVDFEHYHSGLPY